MKRLNKIIALSVCTAMFVNSTSSSVEAAIRNARLLAVHNINTGNTTIEKTNVIQDNKYTITWEDNGSIEVGSQFDKMSGVKGYDKEGNDITSLVSVSGEVDTSKPGEYSLEYSVTDNTGEVIKRTRKVIVEDTKSKDVIVENKNEDLKDENVPSEENKKNEESKIVGASFTRTYLGEPFDYKANIKATDSNGKDITDSITVEGKVDTNKLGSYELKYSVADEKGKVATLTRKVNVVEKNIFNTFIEKVNEETKEKTKELGFSIYLDNNTSKFLVENQSKDKLDPTRKNEVIFKIRVIDKDNKEKLAVELLGDDTGDSEKLNPLKELEYSFGDYIEIHSANAKEGFNIVGEMSGDIDTKNPKDPKDPKDVKKEDYSDGVDNIDYLSNVRFKITEEGIETVYNNAPVISGLEVMDKLLTKRADQLAGVKVTDDHDKEISNDKIKISEEKDSENNVIGLRYTVKDSWGRVVSQVRVYENISNLELSDENINNIEPLNNTKNQKNTVTSRLSNNIIEVHGIEYQDNNTLRFVLGFSQDNMSINVLNRNNRLLDNKITDEYFKLVLYDKYGSSKETLTLNGNEKGTSKKLEDFNKTKFEYGDQIHMFHYYSETKLKIKGGVHGVEGEDGASSVYENGIAKDKLQVIRFELKQDGLKQLTNKPPTISWTNDKLIANRGEKINLLADIKVDDDIDGIINNARVSVTDYNPSKLGEQIVQYTVKDSWGATATKDRTITVISDTKLTNTSIDIIDITGSKKVFSIKFDDYLKKISIKDSSNEQFNPDDPDDIYFMLKIFSKAGITKKEVILTGAQNGFNDALMSLNGYIYSVGDMIELWSPNYKEGIKINGDIKKDKEIEDKDYSAGIDEIDFIKNVRFELQEKQLHARYNHEPKIIFNENLSIKRGEEFNPLNFIKEIKDDHDSLNINLVKFIYNEDAVKNEGEHEVLYTVSDKWGRSCSIKKQITVLPKNKLEESKIELLKQNEDNSTKAIATLCFDDLEKRIYADIERNVSIAGPVNTNVFTVEVFDSKGELKGKSVIKANEGLTYSAFEKLEAIEIQYNDAIHITAYGYNKVSIKGQVTSNHKSFIDYENGFESDDKMQNTRFRVTADGLREVYNEAPQIEGADETTVTKGGNFNPKDGVTVEDDHDGTRPIEDKDIIGTINTSKVGIQHITYKVTDSWGRSSEKIRNVYVKPIIDNNTIEVKNSKNELAFKIGFDFKTFKFTVKDQSIIELDPSNSDKEFVIAIYDSNDKFIDKVELLGTDAGNSSKLQKLKNTTLKIGTQIRVWSKNGDRLSIKGGVLKEDNITQEYENGMDSDSMENVIFQGTENGLEARYNEAPMINITKDKLILYKGDDYRNDLLKGVTITDEKSEYIKHDDIKIMLQRIDRNSDAVEEELKPNEKTDLELGIYDATYSVSDVWGRTSEVTRRFALETSIDRNEIHFGGYKGTTATNGKQITVFKLGFNSEEMKIELRERSSEKFNTHSGQDEYYRIWVYGKDGNIKKQAFVNAPDTGMMHRLDVLDNLEVEYGDYIKIRAKQTFRIKIDGAVRNGKEDYSDGVQQGDDFLNTKFYITEEGLTANYEPPVEMHDGETMFDFLGSGGRIPLRIIFNYENKSMRVSGDDKAQYDYKEPGHEGYNQETLRLNWYRNNGDLVKEYIYNTNMLGPGKAKDLNSLTFEDGDYFVFKTYKNQSIRIEGKLNNNLDENFSDGIDDPDYVTNVRFVLRTNDDKKEMEAVYNQAPVIHGVEDVNIYVGDTFDASKDVSITDDHDKALKYTVSGNYNPQVVKKYPYIYTATDSWGRETTITRNVYVRPAIYKNRIMLYSKNGTTNITSNIPQDVKPAFEIGFDNDTQKYFLANQSDEEIYPSLGDETAFKISIYDGRGNLKESVKLSGRDRGISKELEKLNAVEYSPDDAIRVWSAVPKHLRITGPITGDVTDGGEKKEDYNNGIDNDDYMKNVAFRPRHTGLESIYNEAPEIQGLDAIKEVLFNEEVDLKQDITVSDDKGNVTLENLRIEGTVNKDEIGNYPVKYILTDSWGRSISKEVIFKVVSKIKNNDIEVYGKSATNKDELKFTIKFNGENNKINIVQSSNTALDSSDSEKNFEIVVRNIDTEEKVRVEINGNETNYTSELDKLKDINFSNGDTISVYHKEKSKLKIKGSIEKSEEKNFQESFPSNLEFDKVRFKVTNKGLELFKCEDLNVTFDDSLTIKRGDLSTIYDGIKFNFNNVDSYKGIKTEIKDFDGLTLGKMQIKYIITDSWGQKQEVMRKVTVIERNDLEKNIIKLLNASDKKVLGEFEFDSIEKKLRMKLSGNQYSGEPKDLITIIVYDSNGITKSRITIKSDMFNSTMSLSSDDIGFDYGDLISISVYDNKNGLSIVGDIKGKREEYDNGVDNADNIENVRFKIEKTGLESVYNNAPELTIKGKLEVFKDEAVDFYEGVEVKDEDEHDVNISLEDVQIETDLDITKVGSYKAKYILVDSWGRSSSKDRDIKVKSSLENNKIEYYDGQTDGPVFDISIDNVNNELNINKHYSRFNKNIFKSSNADERIFEVGLFNKEAKLKAKLTILASDDKNSVNEKLRDFDKTSFKYGDYISVFAQEHENSIKIQGNIYKPENITEDYSEGIKDPDFMNNVRFQITVDELKATYNNAPDMEIPQNKTLEHYIGDDIEIGKDIRVRDDFDIDISNRSIIIPESEKYKLETVGEKQIDIVVTDSWGRSKQGSRTINVKDSMDRNEIWFGGYKKPNSLPDMFKIVFDTTEKKIKLKDQKTYELNNQSLEPRFYVINVYNSNGASKLPGGEIVLSARDTANSTKLDKLNDLSFEYGDYIKIRAFQTFRMKILGTVRNGREDYSDGVDVGEDFLNTEFHITKEGLTAKYTKPIQITDTESLIEYNGGEGKPLKIKVNHETGEVTLPANSGGFYHYGSGNKIVFKINWHKASTKAVHSFEFKGNAQGAGRELNNFVRNNRFEEGDYLTFETPVLDLNKNIEISGQLHKPDDADEILENEDFSDGIDNKENMTRTLFHYNKDGIKGFTIEKRGAATINGAEDKDVAQNSTFNVTDGVTATDYDGTTDLTREMTTSGTVNTARLGMYEVVYTVENRYGIETKVHRNIRVYSESALTLKDTTMPPLEQGSIGSDEDSINEYLLSLVQAHDVDDPDIG